MSNNDDNNNGNNNNHVLWLFAIIIVVLVIIKIASPPSASVDMHQLHINSQNQIRRDVEIEDLRRERYGEAPLSNSEIEDIAARNTISEYRNLKK